MIMSQRAFSLKNILLGILLGLTIVAGCFFYQDIRAFFRSEAPQMARRMKTVIHERVERVRPPIMDIHSEKAEKEREPSAVASEEHDKTHEPINIKTLESGFQEQVSKKSVEPYYAEEEALWQDMLKKPINPDYADSYPYSECFKNAASENDIPLCLVLGLAAYLSNFEPGSFLDDRYGIMRLGWPYPSVEMGAHKREELIDNPCMNIKLACRFLSNLLKKSRGKWVPALLAYHEQVEVVRPERISREDLIFSSRLRRHVKEVLGGPLEKKIMFAFWPFEKRRTAEDFMASIEKRAGVELWLGQQDYKYMVFIPAKDKKERDHKMALIIEKAGIKRK